jgi:hypothetical protein
MNRLLYQESKEQTEIVRIWDLFNHIISSGEFQNMNGAVQMNSGNGGKAVIQFTKLLQAAVKEMLAHTFAFPGANDLDFSRITMENKERVLNYYTKRVLQTIYDEANEI